MKKLLALLLCGAMALGTAACGAGNEGKGGTGSAGSGQASGDTQEVVFWHSFSGATEAALASIIPEEA